MTTTPPVTCPPLDWFLTSQWLKCPRLYQFRTAGIRTGSVQSPAIQFGLEYHNCMEKFWNGADYTPNLPADLPTPYSNVALANLLHESVSQILQFLELDEIEKVGCVGKEPELLLAPATELNWKVKTDCVITLPNGDVWILEYKTSHYALSPAALDVYCTSDGQVSGQLYAGKALYGNAFNGVLLVHAKVAATAKARKVTLVPITYSPERIDRWYYMICEIQQEIAECTSMDGDNRTSGRMDTLNCMSFNYLCSFYDSCHGSTPLPAPSDEWVPGEGWKSEFKQLL